LTVDKPLSGKFSLNGTDAALVKSAVLTVRGSLPRLSLPDLGALKRNVVVVLAGVLLWTGEFRAYGSNVPSSWSRGCRYPYWSRGADFAAAAAAVNAAARQRGGFKATSGKSADADLRLLVGNFTFRLVR